MRTAGFSGQQCSRNNLSTDTYRGTQVGGRAPRRKGTRASRLNRSILRKQLRGPDRYKRKSTVMLALSEERPNRGGATTSDGKQTLICGLATDSHRTGRCSPAIGRVKPLRLDAPYPRRHWRPLSDGSKASRAVQIPEEKPRNVQQSTYSARPLEAHSKTHCSSSTAIGPTCALSSGRCRFAGGTRQVLQPCRLRARLIAAVKDGGCAHGSRARA